MVCSLSQFLYLVLIILKYVKYKGQEGPWASFEQRVVPAITCHRTGNCYLDSRVLERAGEGVYHFKTLYQLPNGS